MIVLSRANLYKVVFLPILSIMLGFMAGGQVRAKGPSARTVVRRIRILASSDAYYSDQIKKGCVDIAVSEQDRDYFYVELHENHDRPCPGNPDTAPRLDTFRVNKQSGKIEWWCLYNNLWVPYERFKQTHGSECRPDEEVP